MVPSIYMGTPGRMLNFFSLVLPIPGISIERIWSQDFFPGVKVNGADSPSVRGSSVVLNFPAHSGISRNATDENPVSRSPVAPSRTRICIVIGSHHTWGDTDRVIWIRGVSMTRIVCETLRAGSCIWNSRRISPEVSVPYERRSSGSITSSERDDTRSPLGLRRYQASVDTFSERSVGDMGLPWASSSLSVPSEVAPFARVLDTGVNSIRATGPDRTARVVSPARPPASIAEIR